MRDISDFTILVLPGVNGSGSGHFQTAWEEAFPEFQRVEQADWDYPVYAEWSARLTASVAQSVRPVVLLAHSLGTSLVMRWSLEQPALAEKVAGAFLVAPTDRDRFDGVPDSPVRGFGPMILKRLPIRSVVVASRNDDRVTFERATEFARAWGATLVDAGYQGHMGSAAQLGIWPRGLLWFGQFLASLKTG